MYARRLFSNLGYCRTEYIAILISEKQSYHILQFVSPCVSLMIYCRLYLQCKLVFAYIICNITRRKAQIYVSTLDLVDVLNFKRHHHNILKLPISILLQIE